MRKVKFENKTYCIRNITFPFGERTVGTEKLNDALMDDGGYVSEEARLIDESIFYFVEENNLRLREKELVLKINSEI